MTHDGRPEQGIISDGPGRYWAIMGTDAGGNVLVARCSDAGTVFGRTFSSGVCGVLALVWEVAHGGTIRD